MKKNLLFIFLLVSIVGFSQKNGIKIGLTGLVYGDYSISYERVITPKSSFSLTTGYLNFNPFVSAFGSDMYELGWAEAAPWIDKIQAGAIVSFDYRFYLGKVNAMKGFYLGPYIRFWELGFNLNDYLNDELNMNENLFTVQAAFKSISLGCQLGYQWIISDRISIDWYFFGAGVQRLSGNGNYQLAQEQADFDYSTIIDDVTSGWDKIPMVAKNLTKDPLDNQLQLKTYSWLPDIRGGLKIGFIF